LLVADDPDAAVDSWLEALSPSDPEGVARAASSLLAYARDTGDDLDEEVVGRIRAAIIDTRGAAARDELQLLLATLADARDEVGTLEALFTDAKGESSPEIGLLYVRALMRMGWMERAADAVEGVIDIASDDARGQALFLRGALASTRRVQDPRASLDGAVHDVLEAIDICGLAIAEDVRDLVDWLRPDPVGLALLRRLAERGDRLAQERADRYAARPDL
jgi:hypothetical protein